MNTFDQTIANLNLLAASGDKVRIGYTVSNGKSDKTWEPMPAADAIEYLNSMAAVFDLTGLEFTSVYVDRWEG